MRKSFHLIVLDGGEAFQVEGYAKLLVFASVTGM